MFTLSYFSIELVDIVLQALTNSTITMESLSFPDH